MKNIHCVFFLLVCLIVSDLANAQVKLSSFLSFQYNKTIYDQTLGNNPSAIGIGAETIFVTKKKLHPALELTADAYLEDDKVFRTNINGDEILDIGGMLNIFAGVIFSPTGNGFISVLAGPSFINGTSFGIKPSMGFSFGKKQRGRAKISFINIFNRNTETEFEQDFGTVSFAIGFKLF